MTCIFLSAFSLLILQACSPTEVPQHTTFIDTDNQTAVEEWYRPYPDSIVKTRTSTFLASKQEHSYTHQLVYTKTQPQELAQVTQQRYFSMDTIPTATYPYVYAALLGHSRQRADQSVKQFGMLQATIQSKQALSYQEARAKMSLLINHLHQLYSKRKDLDTTVSIPTNEGDLATIKGEQQLEKSTLQYSFLAALENKNNLFWSNQRNDHPPSTTSYIITKTDSCLVNFQFQVENTAAALDWINF